MAGALNDLDAENWEAFNIFTSDLQTAFVNLAPMAETPCLGLDPAWVRLCLEARRIPIEEWPEMIGKFQVLHRCRESVRG